MSLINKFIIPVIKTTKRKMIENMNKPIPNETQGDPHVYKKWKLIWEDEFTHWAKQLRKGNKNEK